MILFDAATDGRNIIAGMLITALVFVAAIGIGELTRWAGKRRKRRAHTA